MAVNYKKYVADFETTTDPHDLRVWAAGLVNIDTLKTEFIGNDIESFIEFLSNKNSVVYYHNLKFDSQFLIWHLLSKGFKYSDVPQDKTFSTLITDGGVYYIVTVIFEKKNKKYKKAVFYDSLKKFPFKVSQIAKAFGFEDQKLEIDYKAHRPVGHQLTDLERDYLVNDCRIVARALKLKFEQGHKKITNASDAMSSYKEIIGKSSFDTWFPVLPIKKDSEIRKAYKGGFTWLNPKYKNRRDVLGLSYDTNSLYPFVMYTKLLPWGFPKHFDGEPTITDEFPLFIVNVWASFEVKDGHIPCMQLKNNPRFVATHYLNDSGRDPDTGELQITPMTLTNVDLDLFLDHYNVPYIEYIDGYYFRGSTGMFTEYIDYWKQIKETAEDPVIRQGAKDMLNSLYGKFATNPKGLKQVPYLDRDGVVQYKVINTDEDAQLYNADPPKMRDPVYTAMGCFITAYARENTIRTAQSLYDRIIYCDTDSAYIEGYNVPDIDIHPRRLGAWKHEKTFYDCRFIRAKTYIITHYENYKSSLKNYAVLLNVTNAIYKDGKSITIPDNLYNYCRCLNITHNITRADGFIKEVKTTVTCAGMPDNVKEQVNYDNFVEGSIFDGKLVPKRYKGGVVLEERTFTIL